jgi:phosphatidate cytidylyltransferase
MAAGHVYIIGVGVLIQIELFRELVNITYEQARERSMPLFRTLQWSWFTLAMMWNYSKDFHLFCVENPRVMHLTYVTYYSDVVIFVLYCILQITTVLTLRKKILKYQMSQLMWMILTICLVVGQYRFFALNVTSGLFWFIFPSALVIFNDTSAYIFGRAFGKKFIKSEFIAFSPNKTWEGFIGAAVFTITMSFLLPLILTLPPWKKFFVCPAEELLWTPFQAPGLQCEIPEVYVAHTYILHPFKALRGDGWAGLLGALASSTLPAWVSNSVPLGLVENMASLTVSIELLPIQVRLDIT